MKKHFIYLPLVIAAISCAKTRPTERVADADANRFPKAPLVNSDTWFVKETIVSTDTLGGFGFVGLQSNVAAGKFEFSKDKLRFIRANATDANAQTLDSTIYSWDVEHSEYRLAEGNGKVSNRQEENNYLPWNQKTYFKLDFSEADLTLMDTKGEGGCFQNVTKSLVPETQLVSENRITFEVDYTYRLNDDCWLEYIQRTMSEQTTHTVRVRYSFIPYVKDDSYKPYRYTDDTDPLFDKYGYFVSVAEKNNETNRLENVFLMNRWNPTKNHTIYFAPGFPQDKKWIYNSPGYGVIDRTNELLARNNISMRFKIEDAPAGVSFGDLGYSFVKFVEEGSSDAPFGYGPSDANPFTGEIIGSTSVIWTANLLFYLDRIRANLESDEKRENQSTSDLISKISGTMGAGSDAADWTSTSSALKATQAGDIFHLLLPKYTYAPYNLYSLPLGREAEEVKVAEDILKKVEQLGSMKTGRVNPSEFTVAGDMFSADEQRYLNYYKDRFEVENSLGFLKNQTQQVVKLQQQKIRQQNALRAANANTIHYFNESEHSLKASDIEGMKPEAVIDTVLYRVAIHEFGHNLSLRHNFMGSVDERNFRPKSTVKGRDGNDLVDANGGKIESKITSSSVMDYLDLADEIKETFEWGTYDEAALVFAYTGGKVDLAKANKTNYLYCTDEHRSLNAMCNVYDTGSTPTEVALSLIENYDNSYETANKRFGRAYWSSLGYANARFGTMMQLRKFLPFMFETFDASMDVELSKFAFDASKRDEIRRDIKNDQQQAALLVAAFYNAVIQQSKADRPFLDDVTKNGSLRTIGIGPDKLYAAYFLFGAPELTYSVKDYPAPYSFLSLRPYSNVFEKILRDNLTSQPDAYQGFINFGRLLYAETVTNYIYSSNYDLRSRSDLKCLSAEQMQKYLKPGFTLSTFPAFDPDNNVRLDAEGKPVSSRLKAVNLLPEQKSKALSDEALQLKFFGQHSNLAIVEFAGNYLLSSSTTNPFTFDMLAPIAQDWSNDFAVEQDTAYVFEYYRYLRQLEGRLVLDRCNDTLE